MTAEEQLKHRNQLLAFTCVASAYGITCVTLLFFVSEVTKSLGRFLIASLLGVGGGVGLFGWLLSLLLKTQQGTERERTQARLKIVSWVGWVFVVALLIALLLA